MAFYLFPTLMYHRYKAGLDFLQKNGTKKNLPKEIHDQHKIYQACTKGFGRILQFFPNTLANKARQQFLDVLAAKIPSLYKDVEAIPNWVGLTRREQVMPWKESAFLEKYAILGSLYSWINFGVLPGVLNNIAAGFHWRGEKIYLSVEYPIKKVFFKFCPLVKDIFHHDGTTRQAKAIAKNIFYAVINPFHTVRHLLNFFHISLSKCIDCGSSSINWPQTGLKIFVGLVFGILKAPFSLLADIEDLSVSFVAGIFSSKKTQKPIWVTQINDLYDVKLLRKIAKEKIQNNNYVLGQCNYFIGADIKLRNSEYIGIHKKTLYPQNENKLPEPGQVIGIRPLKQEKVTQLAELLSIIGAFRKRGGMQFDETCINEAKKVITPIRQVFSPP